ncbi:uncharacterized protein LOC131658522 [Vicia villosa]|uniref:uncharacterized protein LOC131658522 n=1 Tax=Vicia villosa TaxID=3911 RepID=UPI00273ABFFB|nr:uncharacterized protein LOC131658522 [Vicia villosa]
MAAKGSNGVGVWRKVDYSRRVQPRWDIADGGKGFKGIREEDSVTSFFVSEFGARWKALDLFYEFKAYGNMVEFVIPPKKDRYGRRYGFARFANVKDVNTLEIKLDNLFLDGRKLHVSLTRFNRTVFKQPALVQQDRRECKGQLVGEKRGFRHSNVVDACGQNRSFADVLQNKKSLRNSVVVSKSISFQPSEEASNQYFKAFTGVIKEPGVDVDIKRLFLEEDIFSIRVTYLGPNLCLLEDLIEGEIEEFIKVRKEWWQLWFSSIQPWNPSDVDKERLIWIKITGVPCYVWGEIFFKRLADLFGRFIKCDEGTALKSRMDVARICISTGHFGRVDECINVEIEGAFFSVLVLEECGWVNPKFPVVRVRDDEGSVSSQAEEEEVVVGNNGEESEAEFVSSKSGSGDGKGEASISVAESFLGSGRFLSPKRSKNLSTKKKVVFDSSDRVCIVSPEIDLSKELIDEVYCEDFSRVGDSIDKDFSLVGPSKVNKASGQSSEYTGPVLACEELGQEDFGGPFSFDKACRDWMTKSKKHSPSQTKKNS